MGSRLVLQFVLGVLVLGLPASARADVLVSAASSLTDVLTVIAARYRSITGETATLNFGASNTLARQIAAGARVDVFVSADEVQMDHVSTEVAPGTRVDLLSNRLVVAIARDGQPVRSAADLLRADIKRIAIGDPAAVPAGVYARQYLETLGLWRVLQPKMVPSGSVRLALAAVESGAAQAAIVYATDVPSAKDTRTAFIVPVSQGPMIRYPAAVMKSARNQAGARRFLAFLMAGEARAAFAAAGFEPLTVSVSPGRR